MARYSLKKFWRNYHPTKYRRREFLCFLDIQPTPKGHTLCIPKKEVNKNYGF